MRDFEFVTPKGLREAGLLLKQHGGQAAIKAGGIDLLDLMKEGIATPSVLVNILPLPGLAGIADDQEHGLSIGALATLTSVAEDPLVARRYPLLAKAVGEAATPQLRNVATIGGNLCQRPRCWYFRSADFDCLKKGGDTCFAVEGDNRYHAIFGNAPCHIVSPSSVGLALVALGGSVRMIGGAGDREMLAEKFFVMPDPDPTRETALVAGEVVSGVHIPAPEPGTQSAYIKVREKEAFDWPIAEVAVVVAKDPGGVVRWARIVLGAAAPVPWRAVRAEKSLVARKIDSKTAADAAEEALAGASPMSGNAWRVGLIREVVRRALLQAR